MCILFSSLPTIILHSMSQCLSQYMIFPRKNYKKFKNLPISSAESSS
eukprot:UN24851